MKMIIVLTLLLSIGVQAKETKVKRKTASAHQCEDNAKERALKAFKLELPDADEPLYDDNATEVKQEGKIDVIKLVLIDGNFPYEVKIKYRRDTDCQVSGKPVIRPLKDLN